MGKFAIEKFKKLVSLGNNPSRRTLKNFVEIVRQMEKIDEKAPTLDIISGIVHMGFYYKEGFLQDGSRRTSDIEDLSSITFLDYPKKDPNKLIQDQIKLNDDLKQALRDVASSLRQWKKIKHNGVWVNLGHAMAGLDCELRSGLFKGLLYTYGGDILKRSRDIFLINPPKGEEPGSLTPDDWEGDSLSGDFLKHYHYLKSIEKKPRLSDILEKDMKGSGVKLPAGVDLDAGAPPLEPDAGMPETSGLFHHESSIKPSLSDRIRILEEFNEQPSISSQTRMASTIPELPDFDEQSHFNWQDRQKSTVSGPSERIKILEEF